MPNSKNNTKLRKNVTMRIDRIEEPSQQFCICCGVPMEPKNVVVVLVCGEEELGFVCADCLNNGPSEAAEDGRDMAEVLRAEAKRYLRAASAIEEMPADAWITGNQYLHEYAIQFLWAKGMSQTKLENMEPGTLLVLMSLYQDDDKLTIEELLADDTSGDGDDQDDGGGA